MLQAERNTGLVPLSSSQAGSCLTFANWQDAGIQTLSFDIVDLLMKPGLTVLKSLSDLQSYFNWPGDMVINAASLPSVDRENEYVIRSHYDGGVIRIEAIALFALIASLKPDKVILPQDSARYFSQYTAMLYEGTLPYFHVSDEPPQMAGNAGRYMLADPQKPFSELIAGINNCPFPCYVMGDFDAKQSGELASVSNCLFESDKPARDGMMGLAYGADGLVNIFDAGRMNEHWPVDNGCPCQTCDSRLTRAYLHHLLQHTPLLAQRYLIMHNVYSANSRLEQK